MHLIFVLGIVVLSVQALTCLDEAGKSVDSWVALKGAPNTPIYFIYDEETKSFVESPYNVSQATDGAIMQTVGQLYLSSTLSEAAFGMYNDEAPDKDASSTYAHAKGVILSDAKEGFFLLHSMPHWPNYLSAGPSPFPDITYGKGSYLQLLIIKRFIMICIFG